jgi:hypothetical protein
MPKWKVTLAGKSYTTGEICVEADSLDEAHDMARVLDPSDERIEWVSEPFPDSFHVVAALPEVK